MIEHIVVHYVVHYESAKQYLVVTLDRRTGLVHPHEDSVVGVCSTARNAHVIAYALNAAQRRVAEPVCTGLTAQWCPIHGDCTCHGLAEDGSWTSSMDDPNCPLHAPTSTHHGSTP